MKKLGQQTVLATKRVQGKMCNRYRMKPEVAAVSLGRLKQTAGAQWKRRLQTLLCSLLDIDEEASFRPNNDKEKTIKNLRDEFKLRWSKRVKREGYSLLATSRKKYDEMLKDAHADYECSSTFCCIAS